MSGTIAVKPKELDDAYRALYFIAHIEEGCGGNLNFKEMAESAIRQAKAALPEGYLP